MKEELKKFMLDNLGLSYEELQNIPDEEVDSFYDRVCDLEVSVVMAANGEITEKGNLAAELVDYVFDYFYEESDD